MSHGKGPKATMASSDKHVYSYGITSILSCFEQETGELVWQKTFEEYDPPYPVFYTAASPLIEGDLLILPIGTKDKGALVALNKLTGERVWATKDNDGPAYCSPMMLELGGKRQIVVFMEKVFIGVDPADGSTLWRRAFTTPYDQNVATPVVLDNMLVYSGLRQGTYGARFESGSTYSDVWHNERTACIWTRPFFMKGTFTSTRMGAALFAWMWPRVKRSGNRRSASVSTPQWFASTTACFS